MNRSDISAWMAKSNDISWMIIWSLPSLTLPPKWFCRDSSTCNGFSSMLLDVVDRRKSAALDVLCFAFFLDSNFHVIGKQEFLPRTTGVAGKAVAAMFGRAPPGHHQDAMADRSSSIGTCFAEGTIFSRSSWLRHPGSSSSSFLPWGQGAAWLIRRVSAKDMPSNDGHGIGNKAY